MHAAIFYFFVFFIQGASANSLAEIRVLLDKVEAPNKMHLTIHAPDGFIIIPHSKKSKPFLEEHPCLLIEGQNGSFLLHTKPSLISNKKIPKQSVLSNAQTITITPRKKSPITINDKQYYGNCTIHIDKHKKSYYLINTLPLEEYVYSVLLYESYAHWPNEMQKVQAVATRTFAARCMNEAKNKQAVYDIKNNIFHQRYDGTHNYDHLRQAIEETKDLIITHENRAALTMFDACCGGIIPSKLDTIDFSKAPYLKRSYRCTFCKNFSLYRWKYNCSLHDLTQSLLATSLKSKVRPCGPLKKLQVIDHDAAGSVNYLEYRGRAGNIKLATHKIKNCLGNGLRSKFFTLKQKGDILTFKGKGFGHGLGLCQHGARAMVNKNYDYKKILAYYFPKTKLSLLSKIK
ncbi:SpoIID/LytB domain-containing protein [Candidatus Babeliales bacterium]|nr:SpoIID/LytB domain-containing protein [Candidatus Babeliales bacterium]